MPPRSYPAGATGQDRGDARFSTAALAFAAVRLLPPRERRVLPKQVGGGLVDGCGVAGDYPDGVEVIEHSDCGVGSVPAEQSVAVEALRAAVGECDQPFAQTGGTLGVLYCIVKGDCPESESPGASP